MSRTAQRIAVGLTISPEPVEVIYSPYSVHQSVPNFSWDDAADDRYIPCDGLLWAMREQAPPITSPCSDTPHALRRYADIQFPLFCQGNHCAKLVAPVNALRASGNGARNERENRGVF